MAAQIPSPAPWIFHFPTFTFQPSALCCAILFSLPANFVFSDQSSFAWPLLSQDRICLMVTGRHWFSWYMPLTAQPKRDFSPKHSLLPLKITNTNISGYWLATLQTVFVRYIQTVSFHHIKRVKSKLGSKLKLPPNGVKLPTSFTATTLTKNDWITSKPPQLLARQICTITYTSFQMAVKIFKNQSSSLLLSSALPTCEDFLWIYRKTNLIICRKGSYNSVKQSTASALHVNSSPTTKQPPAQSS